MTVNHTAAPAPKPPAPQSRPNAKEKPAQEPADKVELSKPPRTDYKKDKDKDKKDKDDREFTAEGTGEPPPFAAGPDGTGEPPPSTFTDGTGEPPPAFDDPDADDFFASGAFDDEWVDDEFFFIQGTGEPPPADWAREKDKGKKPQPPPKEKEPPKKDDFEAKGTGEPPPQKAAPQPVEEDDWILL